ncbi:hypothetical protein H696_05677, partial [Fonticula alba]
FHILALILLAPLVGSLLLLPIPTYGKKAPSSGPAIPAKLSWMLQESPPVFWGIFFIGRHLYSRLTQPDVAHASFWHLLLAVHFALHYVYRAFVYPFKMSPSSRPVPLHIALFAFLFCLLNGYVILGLLLSSPATAVSPRDYGISWSSHIFFLGLLIFHIGAWGNRRADRRLAAMRAAPGPGTVRRNNYILPTGGMYNLVSSPHYLAELFEWAGFAVATIGLPFTPYSVALDRIAISASAASVLPSSLAGVFSSAEWLLPNLPTISRVALAFWLFAFANLAPRAWTTHTWYREQFGNKYPSSRRALIPYIL